jgi:hypothetical protein
MSTLWTPNRTKFKRLQKGVIQPIEFKKTAVNQIEEGSSKQLFIQGNLL